MKWCTARGLPSFQSLDDCVRSGESELHCEHIPGFCSHTHVCSMASGRIVPHPSASLSPPTWKNQGQRQAVLMSSVFHSDDRVTAAAILRCMLWFGILMRQRTSTGKHWQRRKGWWWKTRCSAWTKPCVSAFSVRFPLVRGLWHFKTNPLW